MKKMIISLLVIIFLVGCAIPPQQTEQIKKMNTEIVSLYHNGVQDEKVLELIQNLQGIKSKEGDIRVDKKANAIIITDTEEKIVELKQSIRKIDSPKRMFIAQLAIISSLQELTESKKQKICQLVENLSADDFLRNVSETRAVIDESSVLGQPVLLVDDNSWATISLGDFSPDYSLEYEYRILVNTSSDNNILLSLVFSEKKSSKTTTILDRKSIPIKLGKTIALVPEKDKNNIVVLINLVETGQSINPRDVIPKYPK